jgi:hypothetical protein
MAPAEWLAGDFLSAVSGVWVIIGAPVGPHVVLALVPHWRYDPPMTRQDLHADLSARLTQLEARLERLGRVVHAYLATLERHVTLLDRDQAYAFERIKQMELHLFPQVKDDMRHLYDIISEYHDQADQPLDRRTP